MDSKQKKNSPGKIREVKKQKKTEEESKTKILTKNKVVWLQTQK